MIQLLALYDHPADPDAFDRHYTGTHVPLAEKMSGIQRFTTVHPGPDPDGTAAPYYLVAVLEFPDQATLDGALASPEGQAAVADLANFAQAGVTVLAGGAQVFLS